MSISDCTNPESTNTVLRSSVRLGISCQHVLNGLLELWPEGPDDDSSSGLLDHLCECTECRLRWLAFEIAADLADFPS